jgi:hypothetical protein
VTIDFSTALGQVRLLTGDVNESDLALDDNEVGGYLIRYGLTALQAPLGHRAAINRAAADMIDAIATSEALIGKVISTVDGLKTDAAKLADSLRKHAASLRAQANRDDADGDGEFGAYFGVAGGYPSASNRKEAEEYQSFGWC